ncbi:MAG: pyridoxal phosphate-dependent aminotransferase [Eubacterium sp.]|nr:pyridoxal phosphate-dependent aminotransferase [Eubacterium sp.]MDD7209225.1 pyridoxal phosphate-dependent aminotransferase [Lachnospiraceae bacterium]MDY5497949.1 pyridoxal phosphate-dependent aminotransferase [Anaerobutyricum sp.]
MLNRQYTGMLQEKDIIFEIFQYATKRAEEIGEENVFDFSLGNPSVPAPDLVNRTIIEKVKNTDALSLHGYSPSFGIMEAREKIAASLNRRFHTNYRASNIFMTMGAAGALAHALRAVTNPGDEIITFAPCFSEYKPYTAGAGLHLTIIPADTDTFQINFNAFIKRLNPKVSAILINSPNNPSGIVYSTETILRLTRILQKKSEEFGHPIYLISDEPYRDIIFEGVDSPYIAGYYPDTLTCYSFSKSLSLPGERIGYLAVNPDCNQADQIIEICPQISRTIGQNGAASLMQRVIADTCDDTSDLRVYETNKKILYDALISFGYECVEPGGTFYMFPRSPEPDSYAFCEKARKKDLMLVPGDIFGCPGHFRIAYCVPTVRVKKALPIFKELIEER